MKRLLLALAAMMVLAPEAPAQNAITQEGSVIQNSPMMFRGNNRARQGASVGGAPTGQIVTTGDAVVGGRCDYSAPTDQPYYSLCIDAATGRIKAGGTKTPQQGLSIEINGQVYGFPGTGNGNVVGPAPTTVNHVAVWNDTLGTTLKSTSDISLTTLNIIPVAGMDRALSTLQNPSGTVGEDIWYNRHHIINDNIVGPNHNLFGGGVYHVCCGPAAQGWRFALAGRIDVTSTGSASDPFPVAVGVIGNARAMANAPNLSGSIGGGNMNVDVGAGLLNWMAVTGLETDVTIRAGAAQPQQKSAHAVVLGQDDAVQGLTIDAANWYTNVGTSGGWRHLFLLDNTHGGHGILRSTDGTIMGLRGAATYYQGFDFTLATFNGNIFTGPGANMAISKDGDIFSSRYIMGVGNLGPVRPPSSAGTGWVMASNYEGGGEVNYWNTFNTGQGHRFYQKIGAAAHNVVGAFLDDAPSLGSTNLMIYINNTGSGQNTTNVGLGAPDSGGAGFRALRVPN